MARETKIGLIVGLTFIICFAVILANRGRSRSKNSHVAYPVDRGMSGTRIAERGDGLHGDAARAGAGGPRISDPVNPRMIPPASSSIPTSIQVQAPTTGAVASPSAVSGEGSPGLRSLPAGDERSTTTARSARSKLLEELASKINDRFGDGSATVEHTPAIAAATPVAIEAGASRNDGIRSRTNTATPEPARRRPDAARGPPSHHTVVAGETLSKIAARYYGSRSVKLVQALYAANRSVMKSPNLLRVGVELSIPHIEGFAAPSTGGKNAETSVPRSSTGNVVRATARSRSRLVDRNPSPEPKSERPMRWYQVKKNDGYAGIARRLLGDAARWQDIFELNKDKFPDPDRIREGVRIRIPAARAAISEGTRP